MRTNVIRIDDYNPPRASTYKNEVKGIVHEWQQMELTRQLQQAKNENERLMDYLFELTWRIKSLEEKSKPAMVGKHP